MGGSSTGGKRLQKTNSHLYVTDQHTMRVSWLTPAPISASTHVPVFEKVGHRPVMICSQQIAP
jgi:hypothetical protein